MRSKLTVPGASLLSGSWHQRLFSKSANRDSETLTAQITGGLHQKFAEGVQIALDHFGRNCGNAAILFLGLDNFKQLNDLQGHDVGDNFLITLGEQLQVLADTGCLVGYLGRDEFAIFLPKLSRDNKTAICQARQTSERIHNNVSDKSAFREINCQPTASIGIYVFDENLLEPLYGLRCSEAAMYDSKLNGKNQIRLFDESMLEKARASAELVSDLGEAIEDAELELKFQPQVDRNRRIIGAEALVRWNHQQKGNIPPDVFIPIAEENGLINPLTDWVVEQALDTLVRWQRHPQLSSLSLSVNVSAPQIHQESLLQSIRNYAQYYTIDMSRLVIEITERVFFGDLQVVKKVMHGLRELGIRFSLDDYGTGYSSLSQLRELRFDELKIDGTFVRELSTNSNDMAIVRSTLAMAKALGIKCVAEWVETKEQYQFLCNERCDYMQGYLFSPAISLEEFERQAMPKEFDLSKLESDHQLLTPAAVAV